MGALAKSGDEFSVGEWHRLNSIARSVEARMRVAYLRAMRSGKNLDKLTLRQVVTAACVDVCDSSAHVYGLVFNPNSYVYIETIDDLVDRYAGAVDSSQAREAVRRILPPDLPLHERRERLNTFGLDAHSAVKVERYRQEIGSGSSATRDVARVRNSLVRQRGNLLAITETNRVINTCLETLWLDNLSSRVRKADTIIEDLGALPRSARKMWITRRDGRVCNYCDPMDEIATKVGDDFDTPYGLFARPPIHPQCRCFMILATRRSR